MTELSKNFPQFDKKCFLAYFLFAFEITFDSDGTHQSLRKQNIFYGSKAKIV